MRDFFANLLSDDGFMPRWDCGKWSDFHGWLYILSDLGVWSAYTAIPAVLIYFVWRKKAVPFRAVFVLFGAFILACGLTHLLDAIMFWWPAYRFLGLVELATAIVSWTTVFALVPIVPQALALRSPQELEREVVARRLAENNLHHANEELERRIAQRTAELMTANARSHEERQRFETTLASIGDAVIATDIEGRITFLNGVAEALTGWKAAEAQAQPLESVFHIVNEETREPAANPSARALKEGAIVGLANHTLLVPREGPERPIDDSAAPIRDENGDVLGVVLVFRDVTERRRHELAVRESEEQFGAADRRKDEFLAMLAHELRNPLAPIRNALELLRIESDPQTALWARQMMQRQVDHIVRLVDDLLDVSRISQGKIQLKNEPVELSSVVHHALEETKSEIQAQGQQFSLSLPAKPVWLEADPIRLSQIISNLVSNAVKYTDKGGQISLRVETSPGEVTIRVRDSGIGIPSEMLKQIFIPFTQVTNSLDRARGGLGIGLSLVRNLVEMHGGRVWAESAGIGQGSEFAVRLPTIAHDEQPSASDWQPSRMARRRVLVVDDNRESASTMALLLSKVWDHQVDAAHDGLAALDKIAQLKPDVVLLDIGLPGLSGYDVARRIRELPGGDSILLVALTGYGQEEDRRKSTEAGFDLHLVKPVSLEALEEVFRHPKPGK